jgi:hypothetical protein
MIVRNPRSKWLRNSFIAASILLVLFVGGGAAYTYYMGPDATQGAAVAAPVFTPEPTIKPVKPADNATEGVAVQTFTTPAPLGSNASIAVRTNATSKCKISVVYDKVASTDSGLSPKIADDYGTVSWTWTVGRTVPIGKWPVTVECAYHGRSAVVKADLLVTAK